MITACKAYVTCDGSETVWTQPTDEVIKKLKDCIKLYHSYKDCFHRTKERLEEAENERKFDFSEMYIFGKFETFTKRVNKIIDMFETMEMYSHLADSKIEGRDSDDTMYWICIKIISYMNVSIRILTVYMHFVIIL